MIVVDSSISSFLASMDRFVAESNKSSKYIFIGGVNPFLHLKIPCNKIRNRQHDAIEMWLIRNRETVV